MDRSLEERGFKWAKVNRNQYTKDFLKEYNSDQYKSKQILFLAGSPGAGKTDLIQIMLDEGFNNFFIHLDLDEIRKIIPGYNGSNADCFQKGAIKVMEMLIDRSFKEGFNIILDGTFGSTKVVNKNIERAIRKGYKIKIYYVSFPPEIARKYTLARELEKTRKVPFFSFFKQYFNSFKNIESIISQYKQVELIVLKKDLTKSGHSGKIITIKSLKDFRKNKRYFQPMENKFILLYRLWKITRKHKQRLLSFKDKDYENNNQKN